MSHQNRGLRKTHDERGPILNHVQKVQTDNAPPDPLRKLRSRRQSRPERTIQEGTVSGCVHCEHRFFKNHKQYSQKLNPATCTLQTSPTQTTTTEPDVPALCVAESEGLASHVVTQRAAGTGARPEGWTPAQPRRPCLEDAQNRGSSECAQQKPRTAYPKAFATLLPRPVIRSAQKWKRRAPALFAPTIVHLHAGCAQATHLTPGTSPGEDRAPGAACVTPLAPRAGWAGGGKDPRGPLGLQNVLC